MLKNMLIGQSGGPTAVINASLQGAIEKGRTSESIGTVFGMINGIEGFLNDHYIDITSIDARENMHLLSTTPGAYLGSCRYRLPDDLSSPVYRNLFCKFHELNIGYVFYIGGNDSMDTVEKLSRASAIKGEDIRFIGIPKTIDNDLVLTDHTPGFGSAAKFVATTVREISIDAAVYDNKPSVTIVEIMGRHAGWLTGASALARQTPLDNPVLIYLPETDFYEGTFLYQVEKALSKRNNIVVCISEGIHNASGELICEHCASTHKDVFGHTQLAGAGKYLENLVKEKLGVKVRSVELNVCQRCSSHHLSETDRQEALSAGREAVRLALDGATAQMVAFHRVSDVPYKMELISEPVSEICNAEKKVPLEWIADNEADVTKKFLQYVSPLIQGEVEIPMKDGLPEFVFR